MDKQHKDVYLTYLFNGIFLLALWMKASIINTNSYTDT